MFTFTGTKVSTITICNSDSEFELPSVEDKSSQYSSYDSDLSCIQI